MVTPGLGSGEVKLAKAAVEEGVKVAAKQAAERAAKEAAEVAAKDGAEAVAKRAADIGHSGRQERLLQLGADPKVSSADRGWIKQEQNAINRGTRESIRNPPGKELAHTKGREAAKGYSHTTSPSNLQDKDLHRTQHKFDDHGRKNPERK